MKSIRLGIFAAIFALIPSSVNAYIDINVTSIPLAPNACQESGGNLDALVAGLGVSGTGISQPTGGSGTLGWLSGIYDRLGSGISIGAVAQGTPGPAASPWPVYFPTAQPVIAAALPLPSGAATSALQSTINTTLGSPFQAGGSIGNTAFGISGSLPAFSSTPTFKIDQTTPGTTNYVDADIFAIGGSAPSASNPLPSRISNGTSFVDPTQIRALTSSDVVTVSGGATSANQTTEITSLSTIATNTTPSIGSASGSITSNQTVSISPAGYASVCVAVSGAWTGTITPQNVKGGATITADVFSDISTGELVSESITANGTYCWVEMSGASLVQVTGATVASGTANISFTANAASFNYPIYARGTGDSVGSYGIQMGGVDPLSNVFQFQHVNSLGAAGVYIDSSNKPAYKTAITPVSPPATPSDIVILNGSATKTVRITRIYLSSTQTTQGVNNWYLVKRSSANSGGTSTTITPIPLDSSLSAGTATFTRYTANATSLGTSVGNMDVVKLLSPATAPGSSSATYYEPHLWDFTNNPVVLRGTAEGLAINFNGAALPAGLSVDATYTWTEE